MAYPLAVTEQPPAPLVGRSTRAAGSLPHLVGDSASYGSGQVGGWTLLLEELDAFAWWWPGGRATRNHGTRKRTARGIEDTKDRRA